MEIVRDETEQMRLSKEYATIKREMERQAGFENIITQSKAMKSIFGLIEKLTYKQHSACYRRIGHREGVDRTRNPRQLQTKRQRFCLR